MKKRLIPRIVLTILITAAFIGWMALNQPQDYEQEEETSGEALIGGSFTLTDSTGQPFSSEALKGKYSLVFFGFTHCPDMCPTALTTITEALNLMQEKAKAITPVFITVDPARDTPEVMAEYAGHFHPSFIALTGSEEAIRDVVKSYKVFSTKRETEDATDGYTMDHSGYIYLMDAQGRYLSHFTHDISPEELAQRLTQLTVQD